MIAPQLGVGVFVLLLSVGHIGTAVPLMLIWLISPARPGRPPVPGGLGRPGRPCGLLLTWVLVADPLVLVVGIIPLVAVCALRVIRAVTRRRRAGRRAALRARWYEVSLAAAAILAEAWPRW